MTATLYIVGTGPGDPELLTVKAVNICNKCDVFITPKGTHNGSSTALSILRPLVSLTGKTVHEVHFPMKKISLKTDPDPEILVAWRYAAEKVLHYLDRGMDVCFPTLGDPAIYSTGYYLYETISGIREDVDVVFIPGVPAMSSCSASMTKPICLGDEMVAIIPATFSNERLEEIFSTFDTIVLMKVHRVMDRITDLLKKCDLLEMSVLVERAGTEKERIISDFDCLTTPPHYFSTIIVRKQPCNIRVLIN